MVMGPNPDKEIKERRAHPFISGDSPEHKFLCFAVNFFMIDPHLTWNENKKSLLRINPKKLKELILWRSPQREPANEIVAASLWEKPQRLNVHAAFTPSQRTGCPGLGHINQKTKEIQRPSPLTSSSFFLFYFIRWGRFTQFNPSSSMN